LSSIFLFLISEVVPLEKEKKKNVKRPLSYCLGRGTFKLLKPMQLSYDGGRRRLLGWLARHLISRRCHPASAKAWGLGFGVKSGTTTTKIPVVYTNHHHKTHNPSREMVSTRGHPKEFPEPDLTPTKSSPSTPSKSRSRGARKGQWSHTPSNLAIIWLCVSLPLVAWDTGYVMLRPLTMPGGSLHWPL
jgi:hypothetical protein